MSLIIMCFVFHVNSKSFCVLKLLHFLLISSECCGFSLQKFFPNLRGFPLNTAKFCWFSNFTSLVRVVQKEHSPPFSEDKEKEDNALADSPEAEDITALIQVRRWTISLSSIAPIMRVQSTGRTIFHLMTCLRTQHTPDYEGVRCVSARSTLLIMKECGAYAHRT